MTISDSISYKEIVQNDDLEISLGGQFYGALVDDGRYERDFTAALIFFDYCIEDLMLSGVGKFFVKKVENEITYLYSSVSDYGLYYYRTKNGLSISRRAQDLRRPLNKGYVIRCVNAHHLVGRSHYGEELYEGVKRILPGSVAVITGEELESYTYLLKEHEAEGRSHQKDLLGSIVENVLSTYELTGDDCLLFSGGIDSAVLGALLANLNSDTSIVNYRYEKEETDDARIVQEFKKTIFRKIKYKGASLMSTSRIIELMKRDYGTILGPQYFKERSIDYKRLITGQNLDTLMHVDTFAPGSAYQGLIGLLMNSLSFSRRLQISHLAFNNKYFKYAYGLFGRKMSGNELRLIDYLYSKSSEHTELTKKPFDIIKQNPPSSYISSFLLRSWDHYRAGESRNYYKLMKTSRFYKTCHNVNANYESLKENEFNDRITPYTEGPVVHYLLSTKLPLIQLLLPKHIMYEIFNKKSGFSYSQFTYSTSKSRVISYLIHRIKRNAGVTLFEVDKQSEIDEVLLDLINKLDFIIPEFSDLYSNFIDNRKEFKKEEYLKLCRCINMNYFVLDYGDYTG